MAKESGSRKVPKNKKTKKTTGKTKQKTKLQPSVNSRQNNKGNVGARMDIREQTPSQRRTAREAKRINPSSPEIKRSAKRAQGYKIKKNKKKITPVAVALMVMFIGIFVVLSLLFGVLFYANLVKTEAPQYTRIDLIMGLEHEKSEIKKIRLDAETYYREGILFVNMTSVAENFDFIITGDHKEIRYVTNEKLGENVKFYPGTPFACVNGTMIRLDVNVEKNGERVLVPLSFFEEYVSGIKTEFDEKLGVLTFLRNTERSESGNFVKKEITFLLKAAPPSSSLSENELSDEIREKCYFFDMTFMPETTPPVNE